MTSNEVLETAGKIAVKSFSEGVVRGEDILARRWAHVLLDFKVPVEVIDAISKLAKESIVYENEKEICGYTGMIKTYCNNEFKEFENDDKRVPAEGS